MAESRITTWTEKTVLDGTEVMNLDDGGHKKLLSKRLIKQVASASVATPNLSVADDWNAIDAATNMSAILAPASASFPNIIGSSTLLPQGTDVAMGWSADSSYPSGGASVAVVGSGYDNVNNQLAGICNGYHCFLQYNANGHGAILSGSYNWNAGGRSVIVTGRGNKIGAATDFAFLGGGETNDIQSSDHSVLTGGRENTLNNSTYAVINGGYDNTVSGGIGAAVLYGESNTVTGNYSCAGGIDNAVGGTRSTALGNDNRVDGDRALAVGGNCTIGPEGDYSVAIGDGCIATQATAQAFGKEVNNFYSGTLAQSGYAHTLASDTINITFVGGARTTDATTTAMMSVSGRHVFVPNNASITGTCLLQAYDEGSGDTASFEIKFSGKKYAGTVTRSYHNISELHDDITTGTPQFEFASWSGIRPRAVGAVGKNLVWTARVDATVALGPLVDTFTAATSDVITSTLTFVNGEKVQLTTTGTLPAGLSLATNYYVVDGSLYYGNTSFKLSLTPGGDPVDVTDTGSGTHTVSRV